MKWLANGRGADGDVSLTQNSEPIYYTKNKDGQYEIWPPKKKFPWVFLTIPAGILAIGCLLVAI